ncbi:MAG: peptidylprolyl isomerase [Fimbriimonadaceae bacterium]|nr:peptidylprolyl isomerase [Fimbriimonadaceae bacterium]
MRNLSVTLISLLALAASAVAQALPQMVVTVEGRGTIVIELNTEKAPKAANHIAGLARRNFYDGQRFFRVVKEPRPFLIQTGDPASRDNLDAAGTGGSGARIPYEESGLPYEAGYVGLATLPNDKDSGDSQFFILLGPASFLQGQYTIFGRVTQGMDVVQAIQRGDRITSVRITGG